MATIGTATFPISNDLPEVSGRAVKSAEDEVNRIVTEVNGAGYISGDSPIITSPAVSNATMSGTTTLTGATTSTSGATFYSGTAPPTGGTGTGIKLSSTTNFGIFHGIGAPTVSAAPGSIYLRTDGSSTSDRFYICTGGSSWTAGTTAT